MSPDNKETGLVITLNNSDLSPEVKAGLLVEAEKTASEMLQNIQIRPPKIKIAAGGSNNFLFGDNEIATKSFKGIVIGFTMANAFWYRKDKPNPITVALPDDTNLDIPICSSFDGMNGSREAELIDVLAESENISCFGRCDTCYLNKYGTSVNESGVIGKGKACKNGRRLAVIPEGEQLPHVFTLPPTSIKAWDAYVTALLSSKSVVWTVWTDFELEKVDGGEFKYSVLIPKVGQVTDGELYDAIYKALTEYKDSVLSSTITEDEFTGESVPVEVEAEVMDDTTEDKENLPF